MHQVHKKTGFVSAGRGRSISTAQMLLEKASSQLRGERVPVKLREEDELASYLNALTQKTSQQSKSVNFEEFGDISISSGADPMTPRVQGRSSSPAVAPSSKFLKKKTQALSADADSKHSDRLGSSSGIRSHSVDDRASQGKISVGKSTSDKSVEKLSVTSANASAPVLNAAKVGGAQAGKVPSALNKAVALTNKIMQRSLTTEPARTKSSAMESDTDESLSIQQRGIKQEGHNSRPQSVSDVSIGHDGSKFIKRQPALEETKSNYTNKLAVSPSPSRSRTTEKSKSRSEKHKKTKNIMLHSTSNLYLTSEEESLAEFIQRLSSSDGGTPDQRKTPKKHTSHVVCHSSSSPSLSKERQSKKRRSPSPRKSSVKKSLSPFYRGSPDLQRSNSKQDSDTALSDTVASVADSIHGKIVIADSLSLGESVQESQSRSEYRGKIFKAQSSPFKRTSSPSISKQKHKNKTKERRGPKSNILLEAFGVHTIEDLLRDASDKENAYESDIKTEPLDTKKQLEQSTSQIVTEIHPTQTPSQQISNNYSEDIPEKIGKNYPGRLSRQSSASEVRTQYSDEETSMDYSEDFASETLSVAKDSDDDRSSHYKYSENESEIAKVDTHVNQGKKVVIEQRSVEIQTSNPAGLQYQWNMMQTGFSFLGPSFGLDNVDPTPIAASVISPDALEVMTAYSPATLAIHDMMKQQIELIRQFASAHERLYNALTNSNVPDYHYTTLKDTKAFIRKHRKPHLTAKEALKMVSEEMDR